MAVGKRPLAPIAGRRQPASMRGGPRLPSLTTVRSVSVTPSGGLLGRPGARRVRAIRSTKPLRGPTQAVMATRQALEPGDLQFPMPARQLEARPLAGTAALATRVDMLLLSAVVCLLMLGAVFIYSASMYQSYEGLIDRATTGNVNYFISKQVVWLALGALALIFASRFDYQKLRRFSMSGLGVTALLLLLVNTKLGHSSGNASRWIYFHGFSIQPSEIAKLALTIYAAHWLSSKGDEIKHSAKGLVPFGAVLGFTTLLIFRQPDLGTGTIVVTAMVGMFFVSGARLRHLMVLFAMALPVFYFVTHHGTYWQARIDAWQHPWADTQGVEYQISRALLAFWHGGLTGVGLGNGTLKETIPAPQTDTIFATIGEETGLLGALAVVALYGFFAYRGIRISVLAGDLFGKLLAAGITTYLVCQALLNMLSVTNTIPFTGVPLPFISFGGTSLVINLLAVGILLNISRHLVPVPEERSDVTGTYLWWRKRRPHLSMPERRSTSERRSTPRRRIGRF